MELSPVNRRFGVTTLLVAFLCLATVLPGSHAGCTYTIRSGDTLWKLSQTFKTTVAVLESLNPGIVPTNLQIGQVINVPCTDGGGSSGGGSTSNGGCPSGWSPAVGTLYDSWPKPGTRECVQYSGCRWAGMFNNIDGGSKPNCRNGAQLLDGGNGVTDCRFSASKVASWSIAATFNRPELLNRHLQVMVAGKPDRVVAVNVKDVCANSDCGGCCSQNTGNNRWPLLDLEKTPASQLLGFSTSSPSFDINNVNYPGQGGLRPGAPSGVMALCYKDAGPSPRIP